MADHGNDPEREPQSVRELTVRLRVLEFHAVHHCNLVCEGCSHFAPDAPRQHVDATRFRDSVAAAAERLRPTWVHLMGGEPLLHPHLCQLLIDLQLGFPDAVRKVVTNGTLMAGAAECIYNTLAATDTVVAVSVYPNVTIRSGVIEARCRSHGIALELLEQFTFLDFLDLTGQSDPLEARLNCPMEGAANVRDDTLFPCPVTAWGQFVGLPTGPAEGVPLSAAVSELAWLLSRRRITSCCRFCRPRPARFPHRQRLTARHSDRLSQLPDDKRRR